MKRILSVLFSSALMLALLPTAAFAAPNDDQIANEDQPMKAQEGNIATGTWGTCPWELSADGTLTVHPGEGEGTYWKTPWNDYDNRKTLRKIVFASEGGSMVVAPSDCTYLFWCNSYPNPILESIDFSGFDTSKVTNMSYMFEGASSLVSLDLSNFDTFRVRNMSNMFNRCSSLEFLDVENFDTSNVTNMSSMFSGCSALKTLNLSNFETFRVQEMSNMFKNCTSLESLNMSGFDVTSVRPAHDMFTDCSSLSMLDLSSFDTSKWYGVELIGCYELERVIVGEKTLARLSLPDTKVNGHMDWYSVTDGAWYTVDQISENRRTIADVYTKKAQVGPAILSGNNVSWKIGSSESVTIRSTAAFKDFECVKMDGTVVDASNYELREGSTVVEFKPSYLSKLSAGTHSVDIVSKSGTASTNLMIAQSSSSQGGSNSGGSSNTQTGAKSVTMLRLYNPNTGEHLFTSDTNEKDTLVRLGWKYEGQGWKAPASGNPVYRLYNPNTGEHHFTMDKHEYDSLQPLGWKGEGRGWYSDSNKGVPIYRLYNKKAPSYYHHYTTDMNERSTLTRGSEWVYEGEGWYGVK